MERHRKSHQNNSGARAEARLIWAATTPLRDGKGVTYDTKAEYSNDRIAARNTIAAEIVTAQKIPTNDLNARCAAILNTTATTSISITREIPDSSSPGFRRGRENSASIIPPANSSFRRLSILSGILAVSMWAEF